MNKQEFLKSEVFDQALACFAAEVLMKRPDFYLPDRLASFGIVPSNRRT
jgi:hypothetical protein